MTLQEVNRQLLTRYSNMSNTNTYANKMSNIALEHLSNWPIDKTSRWIGYIQCLLIQSEITTINKERDFSRPLFHLAYKTESIDIPESINIKEAK